MHVSLPPTLPFPAGQGPFRIKGSVYAGVKARYAKQYPGGLDGLAQLIGDPDLETFCKQKFLSSGWYDYFPMLLLARARGLYEVKARGQKASYDDVVDSSASSHAEADLGGIYKILLKFMSPEAAMGRMPGVHRQYFDFGETTINRIEKGVSDLTISGWPDLAFPFYRSYATAFVHRLIVLSGGISPRAEWDPPIPDGERSGVRLVAARVRTTWT